MIVRHDLGNPSEDPDDMVEFDLAKYRLLRKKYDRAIRMKYEIFMFENHAIVTKYAEYLLEYLQTKFKE